MALFIQVDAGIVESPEYISMGDDAYLLYQKAAMWSLRHLTDGRLTPAEFASLEPSKKRRERLLKRLTDAGVIELLDGSYVLTWLLIKFPTLSQMERSRASDRTRSARYRENRAKRHAVTHTVTHTMNHAPETETKTNTICDEMRCDEMDHTPVDGSDVEPSHPVAANKNLPSESQPSHPIPSQQQGENQVQIDGVWVPSNIEADVLALDPKTRRHFLANHRDRQRQKTKPREPVDLTPLVEILIGKAAQA